MPEPKSYVADVEEQVYDPARVANVFKRCRPVTNHAYLEGRGLTGSFYHPRALQGGFSQTATRTPHFLIIAHRGFAALNSKTRKKPYS